MKELGKCERCSGPLIVREGMVVCASCGGIHQRVKGKWAYTGGGK